VACVRCPQVVTNSYEGTDLQRWVADPESVQQDQA
jgi:hypothetical protein